MPRDPRAYLWDARKAAVLVDEFVAGRSWEVATERAAPLATVLDNLLREQH